MSSQQVLLGFGTGAVVNPLAGGSASSVGAGTRQAGWRFNIDGTVDKRVQGVYTFDHRWFSPSGGTPGNSYWIKFHKNSGTDPNLVNPGLDVWLALSSAREWTLQRAPIGVLSYNATISISSDSSGSPVLSTGTYTSNVDAS